MSHTPGPWKAHDYEAAGGEGFTVDAGDYQICEGWLDMGPIQRAEAIANARLIAAAPDMKLALERARGCIKGLLARTPVRDVTETMAEIDAAIAKATGETP